MMNSRKVDSEVSTTLLWEILMTKQTEPLFIKIARLAVDAIPIQKFSPAHVANSFNKCRSRTLFQKMDFIF